ncbi:MAG TPA: hypothetical protein VJJ21_00195 [Candidatus Nanoarchaeia archaeon]|nr:hypothetical protein [Candidatus Nanoarchaeia archaeon]
MDKMKIIQMEKIAVNVVVEREKCDGREVFIATSPDVNVFAEGKTIDEAMEKFKEGVKFHLESFPEERKSLIVEEKDRYEMPLLTRMFL